MISVYKDSIKDAMFRKKGTVVSKNTKTLVIAPVHAWTPDQVKRLRKSLSLSQTVFAELMGVSHATVVAWENGVNIPAGAASRLMDILTKNPDVLLEAGLVEFR